MVRVTIKNLQNEFVRDADLINQSTAESWFAAEFGGGQYTAEYADVTAEYTLKESLAKAILAQKLGQEVWANAWVLIKAKGVSDAGADALISDANLSAIERFTKGGFFLDAKRKVQALDNSLFSSEEKLALIALLEAADAKLA